MRLWQPGFLITVAIILLPVIVWLTIVGTLLGSDFGGCSEREPIVEVVSPNGQYVARSSYNSCGGAVGDFWTHVTLRPAGTGDAPAGEIVFAYIGEPTGMHLHWLGEQVLEIQHRCGSAHRPPRVWRDVVVLIKFAGAWPLAQC